MSKRVVDGAYQSWYSETIKEGYLYYKAHNATEEYVLKYMNELDSLYWTLYLVVDNYCKKDLINLSRER